MKFEPVMGAARVDSFGEENNPDPDPGNSHHHPVAPVSIVWMSRVTDEPRVVRVSPMGFQSLRT